MSEPTSDKLTAESAAVIFYAAYWETSPERAASYISPSAAETFERIAAEHERICAERIATAEREARVRALEDAANECLKTGSRIGSAQGRAAARLCCKDIQALVTAAEARVDGDVT